MNHWTPEKTKDLECANELCERDDRIILEVRLYCPILSNTLI